MLDHRALLAGHILQTLVGTHYIAFISSTGPEVRKAFLKRPDRKYYKFVALQSMMQLLTLML